MSPLLSVRGLEVSYGGVQAVRGIDFDVEAGTVLTILGANGAGKTSTVRSIAGFQRSRRDRGEILLDGAPAPVRTWRARRAGIAHVPEGRQVFAGLTVRENLRLGGFGRRIDLSEVFDLLPRLAERQNQIAGTLSGGEQQMLAIGRALVSHPRLLLLDEPTLGLAPIVCDDVFDQIEHIRSAGMTLVLVEQKTSRALSLADHVLVMRGGRVVLEGPPEDFSDPATLAAAYMDGTAHSATSSYEDCLPTFETGEQS